MPPQLYDRYMVPILFQPYAEILAEQVVGAEPADALETAAGTGVPTQILASDLPATVSVLFRCHCRPNTARESLTASLHSEADPRGAQVQPRLVQSRHPAAERNLRLAV